MDKAEHALDAEGDVMSESFMAGPFLLVKESGKQGDDAERLTRAAMFGIDAHRLPEATRWATDHFEGGGFAWPNGVVSRCSASTVRRASTLSAANGLETDFERLFGIRFNQWGLIDELADAARCVEFANRPDVSPCAIAWHPWLITEHVL